MRICDVPWLLFAAVGADVFCEDVAVEFGGGLKLRGGVRAREQPLPPKLRAPNTVWRANELLF